MAATTTFSTRSSDGGAPVSKTDILDIAGLSLITLFAFAVWPPLALLAFGTGLILASKAAT